MIDVDCTECGKKIGTYAGPLGANVPIRSQFFKRNDGSKPAHGSSTAGKCPNCEKPINELICVMNAAMQNLANDPATMQELIAKADPGARP